MGDFGRYFLSALSGALQGKMAAAEALQRLEEERQKQELLQQEKERQRQLDASKIILDLASKSPGELAPWQQELLYNLAGTVGSAGGIDVSVPQFETYKKELPATERLSVLSNFLKTASDLAPESQAGVFRVIQPLLANILGQTPATPTGVQQDVESPQTSAISLLSPELAKYRIDSPLGLSPSLAYKSPESAAGILSAYASRYTDKLLSPGLAGLATPETKESRAIAEEKEKATTDTEIALPIIKMAPRPSTQTETIGTMMNIVNSRLNNISADRDRIRRLGGNTVWHDYQINKLNALLDTLGLQQLKTLAGEQVDERVINAAKDILFEPSEPLFTSQDTMPMTAYEAASLALREKGLQEQGEYHRGLLDVQRGNLEVRRETAAREAAGGGGSSTGEPKLDVPLSARLASSKLGIADKKLASQLGFSDKAIAFAPNRVIRFLKNPRYVQKGRNARQDATVYRLTPEGQRALTYINESEEAVRPGHISLYTKGGKKPNLALSKHLREIYSKYGDVTGKLPIVNGKPFSIDDKLVEAIRIFVKEKKGNIGANDRLEARNVLAKQGIKDRQKQDWYIDYMDNYANIIAEEERRRLEAAQQNKGIWGIF